MPEVNFEQNTPKPSSSLKPILIVLGVLILAGTSAYAGYCYGKQQVPSLIPIDNGPVEIEVPESTPPAKTDETAGWKTYENAIYGYELRYPQILVLAEDAWNDITLQETGNTTPYYIKVSVHEKSKEKIGVDYSMYTTENFKSWLSNVPSKGSTPILYRDGVSTLGGFSAVRYVRESPSDASEQTYRLITWLRRGSADYLIELGQDKSAVTDPTIRKLYDQILSSFKLVDVTPAADTSTWKIYKNEKYSYEFMYPPFWEMNRIHGGPPSMSDAQLAQSDYVDVFDPATTSLDNGDKIIFSAIFMILDRESHDITPVTCEEEITDAKCVENIFSKGYPATPIPKYSITKIAGMKAIRVDSEHASLLPVSEVYFKRDQNIFRVDLTVSNESRLKLAIKIFDQILSSFKFLE